LRKIFGNHSFSAGKEDAADIYSRGVYTVGKSMIDEIQEKITKIVERCSKL